MQLYLYVYVIIKHKVYSYMLLLLNKKKMFTNFMAFCSKCVGCAWFTVTSSFSNGTALWYKTRVDQRSFVFPRPRVWHVVWVECA